MEANARTPRDLFNGTFIYEVPPFQRPYVWTEEDQWQPLWDDIERLTETVIGAGAQIEDPGAAREHFLGAVVLKQLQTETGDPIRRSIIDGQQRLVTLQVLLDAAQLATEGYGDEEDAESLQELVVNPGKRFTKSHKRFKVRPSRIDRAAFEAVMDNDLDVPDELLDARIVQAHDFFEQAIESWAEVTGDPDKAQTRLAALCKVLQERLQLVAIDLGVGDDDQLIFETLNDRGTPLLAADLIKNFVFQQCDELGVDADEWAEKYWEEFDGDWWREEVAQGRLYRSRIDLFLQYWLTMRTLSEVPTEATFARFRSHARERLRDKQSAEVFLRELRSDADTFRDLTDLDPQSAGGSFYLRVVEALELGAFTPLLLQLISHNHLPPQDQMDKALRAVESWAVRRTLLRRTMKDVNHLVVALLKDLDEHPLDAVGDAATAYLLAQTADARDWPTDDQVRAELPGMKVYGNIKQQRLRMVLAALEMHLRTELHDKVALQGRPDIEHIMPQGWRTHWEREVAQDPVRAAERDALVNTIGNLTLATKKLNSTLSNRPWLDEDAEKIPSTGKYVGWGKRSLLHKYSLLALTKECVADHQTEWTEDDIRARSGRLTEAVLQVWERPAAGPLTGEEG